MRSGFRAGGLAVTVALVTAVAASAATIETKRFPGTPALAGDSVLWTHYASDGALEIWSAVPGSSPAQVERVASLSRPGYWHAELAASSALTLLTTTRWFGTPRQVTPTTFAYRVGPAAGPLEQIVECPTLEPPIDSAAADVSGEAYAYRKCDDDSGNAHVEIRDAAPQPESPPRSVGVGLGGFEVAIAGRYVAWLEWMYSDVPGREYGIVVYDRVAGTDVYRVPSSELESSPSSLDVQDDGKVAFVLSRGRADRRVEVAWSSVADPQPHFLPLPPREHYAVRIAGDRIAYQAGEFTLHGAIEDAEVGVVDLGGQNERIALGTKAVASAYSFDYDGESFLWRELGCQRWRLVRRAESRPNLRAPAKLCRLRLTRPPSVGGKKATFGLRCAPLPRPCRFDVFLHLGGENGPRAGTVLSRLNPVRIKLARRTRRLLEKRGEVRVTATAIAYGEALPYDTFQQVRRGTIRLSSGR